MKLTLDRDALLAAMTRASGIVARRSTVPILSNVLLSATDALTIRATDLDLQAVVTVAARIDQPGDITVPAATLLDIAKATPEGAEISMALTEGRLHVNAGRARWKLPTLPANDFPSMAPPEWEWSATMAGSDLADILGRVAWAVSPDHGKEYITGARLSVDDGAMISVGTDGRDIAVARTDCDAPDYVGVTVPARTCQEILRFCGDADITIRMAASMVGVETPSASLVSKVIALPYATWDRIMDASRPDTFTVDRKALTAAVRRAMISADATTSGHGIRLTLTTGRLTVSGRSAHSEASDDIDADYDGADTFIGMNSESVIEQVGMLKRDDATFRFAVGKQTPLLIEAAGDLSVVGVSAPQKVA